jgi:hypothetical protein
MTKSRNVCDKQQKKYIQVRMKVEKEEEEWMIIGRRWYDEERYSCKKMTNVHWQFSLKLIHNSFNVSIL